ncbi:hypothetical protein G6F59_018874 [Rhizopus arrhizus]|nr:hypothetical protein G6F59_018874 [Rhizopus arrhizus]
MVRCAVYSDRDSPELNSVVSSPSSIFSLPIAPPDMLPPVRGNAPAIHFATERHRHQSPMPPHHPHHHAQPPKTA